MRRIVVGMTVMLMGAVWLATSLVAPSVSGALRSQLSALTAPSAGQQTESGYDLVASDGGIFSYGDAQYYGSTGGTTLNKPIVGMAATPDGLGYWLVASDGGIFSYGDAQYYGSTGGTTLNKPIVGMAATPDGLGYWLVASDGGIFSYGDAQYYGSTGGTTLNKPIVGMAATPDGLGYWLVASDGGIFSYGDAQYYGSTGGTTLNKPIVGMAATPDGLGYWLVASDGGIFSYGDAQYYGSTGGTTLNKPIVGMAATPDGLGYWLVASDGGIFSYGDAQYYGSTGGTTLNKPIVGMAATPPQPTVGLFAHLDPSFVQSSADPLNITYSYSASAVIVEDEVEQPDGTLPDGVLELFSATTPGQAAGLVCSINVGGSIDGGTCNVEYKDIGTYQVTTTYISGTDSATLTEPETISPFTASITATDQPSGYGTTTAPDGTTCTAAPDYGCQLLSAAIEGKGDAQTPRVGALTFSIYDNAGEVIGTLTPKVDGQTYCLIIWYSSTSTSASSPDCSGTASYPSVVLGFQYGATFEQPGYVSATTGELTG